jgi:hypothetical protein
MALAGDSMPSYVENRVVAIHAQTDDPNDADFAGFEPIASEIKTDFAGSGHGATALLEASLRIWRLAGFDEAAL